MDNCDNRTQAGGGGSGKEVAKGLVDDPARRIKRAETKKPTCSGGLLVVDQEIPGRSSIWWVV